MDARAELNKIWKDMQMSAREFAVYGLTMSSKALDFTATTLKTLEGEMKKTAEKWATKPEDTIPPTNTETTEPPR